MESLDLLKHFPPVSDSEWQNLLEQDLSWEPTEGIEIQPFYRRSVANYSHVFDHTDFVICVETQLDQTREASLAGAEALSFLLDQSELIADEVPFGEVPLFFRGDGIDLKFFEHLCHQASSRGYDISELQGSVTFSDQIEVPQALEAVQGTPLWSQVIDITPWHDVGASLIHQLACAYASLSDVLAEFGTDDAVDHLYFRIPVGERILLEIAHLRALRIGVSRILDAYQTQKQTLPIMAVPSSRYETRLDPDTHLARQTLQYTAAIIGGSNVIVSTEIEHGPKMLQILRHEGNLNTVADAAAGSWMIEALTDSFASEAWKIFQSIEEKGGMKQSHSWMNLQIQQTQEQRSVAVLSGDIPVVGGNIYLSDQFEDTVSHEKSLVASLEDLRRRAHLLHPPTRVQIHGSPSSWLHRLMDICALEIVDSSADIHLHARSDGFTAENAHEHRISINEGESLVVAANDLLKLAHPHAS